LKQAIAKCPPEVWDNPKDKDRFWFIAYHTLYYAHRYLKTENNPYVRWKKADYRKQGFAMTKEQVLAYLKSVQQEVVEQIAVMDLDGKALNGFLANKMELQFYNLRHIQQHAGELYERLRPYELKLGWVSQRSKEIK
jgi:hypothetical protein